MPFNSVDKSKGCYSPDKKALKKFNKKMKKLEGDELERRKGKRMRA